MGKTKISIEITVESCEDLKYLKEIMGGTEGKHKNYKPYKYRKPYADCSKQNKKLQKRKVQADNQTVGLPYEQKSLGLEQFQALRKLMEELEIPEKVYIDAGEVAEKISVPYGPWKKEDIEECFLKCMKGTDIKN